MSWQASKFALMGFYESLRMELNAKKLPAGSERTSITMVGNEEVASLCAVCGVDRYTDRQADR